MAECSSCCCCAAVLSQRQVCWLLKRGETTVENDDDGDTNERTTCPAAPCNKFRVTHAGSYVQPWKAGSIALDSKIKWLYAALGLLLHSLPHYPRSLRISPVGLLRNVFMTVTLIVAESAHPTNTSAVAAEGGVGPPAVVAAMSAAMVATGQEACPMQLNVQQLVPPTGTGM